MRYKLNNSLWTYTMTEVELEYKADININADSEIRINGEEFEPANVLQEMAPLIYQRGLDVFLDENFTVEGE